MLKFRMFLAHLWNYCTVWALIDYFVIIRILDLLEYVDILISFQNNNYNFYIL